MESGACALPWITVRLSCGTFENLFPPLSNNWSLLWLPKCCWAVVLITEIKGKVMGEIAMMMTTTMMLMMMMVVMVMMVVVVMIMMVMMTMRMMMRRSP